MRRGVAVAALIGGFVTATTLPAAAQYVGWSDPAWDGGVGVSVGFRSPGFYGGYYAADYPAGYYVGPTAGYAYSAPAPYAYGGSYGAYGSYPAPYAATPGYSYSYGGPILAYEPDYTYGTSTVTVGGGYREGIRSRGVRYARTDVGEQTISRGVRERGTMVRSGSTVRSNSAVRARGSAQAASVRGGNTARAESTVGRGEPRSTTSPARGELRGGMSRSRSGAMSGETGAEIGR